MRMVIGSDRWNRVVGVAALVLGLVVTGCALPQRGAAVPRDDTSRAAVPGIPNARFWLGDGLTAMAEEAIAGVERERAAVARAGGDPDRLPPAHFLAVSGGGEDGAFGAGLLVGWTQTGTRPQFKLVTGVSTGALTAPFAFLGPEYDDRLRAVYTDITAADIFEERGFTAALFDDAMSDTSPLRHTVERYADAEMLRRIAEEYEKGRFLLIGTTDLDARRPVVWNIGAIAASGSPDALDLFHTILVASAAVPGAFPPVMIDVELDGQPYQEMHVDGGASAQVFVYPPSLDLSEARGRGNARDRVAYVIRNARLDPDWADTERRTLSIVGRAVSSLIQSQGIGDLYRIYLTTRRDGVAFNLAYIGLDFDVPLEEPFDPHYMRALFDYGYALGRNGYPWQHAPPGFHELTD